MFFISLYRSILHIKPIFLRHFSSSTKAITNSESLLSYSDNILVLSLVLPSRQETCRFYLNLQTSNIGQLIDDIKAEDAGIEHVHIFDETGKLLAKSYSIQSLIRLPFTIQLNQQRTFLFDPIRNLQIKEQFVRDKQTDRIAIEETASALYYALNIMKVYHSKYFELNNEANDLIAQLEPLEQIKNQLADICQRYTSRCIWYGLAGMSFQVGILAELTWDVYSWDIVEPISYFIAFATAMSAYAFHLMTRTDFEYVTFSDRLFLRKFYREARRQSFDILHYNRLKTRLFLVQTDLARLRAPLSLSLPVPPNPLRCKISDEEINPLNIYRQRQHVEL